MIAELGHFSIVLALICSVVLSILPMIGAQLNNVSLMAIAQSAARAQFLLVSLGFLALVWAFVTNDFSLSYVAANSNSSLPLGFRISAVWGAHEGSLLLWVLILSIWMAAFTCSNNDMPPKFKARVLAILGIISFGFLVFMLFTSNPFLRSLPSPANGLDLNPLLQDLGLIIHPPILYAGYVGFSVPFALAVAALLGDGVNPAWARWARPWVLIAWSFLTIGISLGSWWAYYELGWGGWWFWDPVENASFMPWLLGTALIHSLAASEKRNIFKSWTVLLAITTFGLSLIGTFLVRSGILTSVHAFATDPTRGVYILIFLTIVIGGALSVFAANRPKSEPLADSSLASRETFLLTNSIFLSVATATVLLGTLYPLLIDALGLGKMSVGAPYFNSVFIPLMVPLLMLIGFGQSARWRKDNFKRLLFVAKYPAACATTLAIGAWAMLDGTGAIQAALALLMAFWVIVTTMKNLYIQITSAKKTSPVRRAFLGQSVAHIGFAVTVIGVTLVSIYSVEKHVRMSPGESVEFSSYQATFNSIKKITGPNYSGVEGTFSITQNDQTIAVLFPQKRNYNAGNQTMTEAGISAGITKDIYIALGEKIDAEDWGVRLNIKPFVRWIWYGAFFMAVGGTIAASDFRFKRLGKKQRNPVQA
jgi:cytochrome c-type biogenesis protein CcmF